MEEAVDDHMAARNLLVQNLLILVGVIAASEMSHTGRRVAGDILTETIAYVLNPTDEQVITPIAPSTLYG